MRACRGDPSRLTGPAHSLSSAGTVTPFQPAAIIAFTGLTTAFLFPFIVVFMPLVVKQVFGGDERALGAMMSAAGLGALLGALSLLRVPAAARGKAILIAASLAGVSMFAITLARTPWQATAMVPIFTYCLALSIGLGATILQITAPPALRGRVLSVHALMWTGLMPSVSLGLGALADLLALDALDVAEHALVAEVLLGQVVGREGRGVVGRQGDEVVEDPRLARGVFLEGADAFVGF